MARTRLTYIRLSLRPGDTFHAGRFPTELPREAVRRAAGAVLGPTGLLTAIQPSGNLDPCDR